MEIKNKNLRNILFGFIAWLVPFVVSFLFYGSNGEPLYDAQTVHNVLLVVGIGVCSFLLIKYFKGITKDYVKEGLIVGITWFAISAILDIVLLVSMFQMSFITWAGRIGISYLAFPMMSVSMGVLLDCKLKR